MTSATFAQHFVAKLMVSPQNRALAVEADRIRELLRCARQLQPDNPKHAEYRRLLGDLLFTPRVHSLVQAATMFDPILLSAVVEITSICKNRQWIGLPNWQNITEDDPRIEKHPLIHRTWYINSNQQMLQAPPDVARPIADPPAVTPDAVLPPINNAVSAAFGAVGKRQPHVFAHMSQAHAKGMAKDVGAPPVEEARGRPEHWESKKRGTSESESRPLLAEDGSHKRIRANERSNTVIEMVEDVPKGVACAQHPETNSDSPAGSSKAAGISANPLAGPSGAVGAIGPCPRCARERKTCIRGIGKTGPRLVCTECRRLKVRCQLFGNQPSRQRARGEPRSPSQVRAGYKSTRHRSPSRHRRSPSVDDRLRAKSGVRGEPRSRSPERARARSTSARRRSLSPRGESTSVVRRRPLTVMSYVLVPRLEIGRAPESPAAKLRSMERKMSNMEDTIKFLHREVETLRTIVEASS
ncbi:uncharacterized protein EDB91DRAFT_495974 [Suillus paluster]|uniref:uncharacterized protein n=1 Tax=Suillus paluster TaxID=48578 RepID=UPI001B872AA3|nr:uncharacterized protein EDB91DRAFT_495974 [Suillus paluster]KAG1736892.1 hypothetical protein EDB91DRAFT_495974 [Suillus paluster]